MNVISLRYLIEHIKRWSKKHDDIKLLFICGCVLFFATCIAVLSYSLLADKQFIIPILLATIGVGTLILYWSVSPLVRKVIRSKKRTKAINLRLRAVVDHVADGIVTFKKNGVIEALNAKAAEIFGYSPYEVIDKNFDMFIVDINKQTSPDDSVLDTIEKIANKPHVELVGIGRNGSTFPIELAVTKIRLNQQEFYVAIIRDISIRKREEAKLQESENRFHSAFDSAATGMSLVSLDGGFIQVNLALCRMLGYSEEKLLTINTQAVTHPDDLKSVLKERKKLLESKEPFFQLENRYLRSDGDYIWILMNVSLVRSMDDKPLYFIIQYLDITKQKTAEEQLSYKAYFDPLTGLANRSQLESAINQAIASAQRHQHLFAVLFLDLDRFKKINDSLGHDVGDQLLKITADRLKACVRRNDIVARLGGDEFVVVITELREMKAAIHATEKIINSLLEPMNINQHELVITTSIGISFYPMDGINYETLIKNSDLALYRAKSKGRNNYQVCTPEISGQIQEKLAFEMRLEKALAANEFDLNFQPRLDLESGTIVGLEAFLRWDNKEYGKVTPLQIISWAEESGLIVPLGNWIIKSACHQAQQWNKNSDQPLKIAVNLSARQFKNPRLIENIINNLNEINFDPQNLEIEVTESIIMQDPEHSLIILHDLREYGIKLVIDDFGTGYSSIDYLQQFTVDYFKIDQKFVQSIVTDASSRTLIMTLIHLAKNLGIRVIAEGVETDKQFAFLKQCGCHEIQGYYLCRPLPANEIAAFLEKQSMLFS